MASVSRRGLLASAAALGGAPSRAAAYAAGLRSDPDLVLHNGKVWTVADRLPQAEAIAIVDGRIMAVGSSGDMLAMAGPRTRKLDLGGKRVTPGFNDAHAHPCESGVDHLKFVACDKDRIEDIQAALRDRAAKTSAGAWVRGFLYDDGKTPRPLSRRTWTPRFPTIPSWSRTGAATPCSSTPPPIARQTFRKAWRTRPAAASSATRAGS